MTHDMVELIEWSLAHRTHRKTTDMEPLTEADAAYRAGDHPRALELYLAALAMGRSASTASLGCGCACDLLGRHEEAQEYFQHVIAAEPEHALAHRSLGLQYLLHGDFSRGWPEYRWHYRTEEFDEKRPQLPPWDGRADGRRIVVVSDQGLGDALQFARYLPALREHFSEIVFEGDRQLEQIVTPLVAKFIPTMEAKLHFRGGYPGAGFECYTPLSCLPGFFGAGTTETIRAPVAIEVPPALAERARRDHRLSGGFKVAIAWKGSPGTPRDSIRSLAVDALGPLLQVPGIDFYAISRDLDHREARYLDDRGVRTFGNSLQSLDWNLLRTAAILADMRLVITCDSVIAHLAASMGLPTWIALPFASEWRWRLDMDRSDWYPAARLYRQTRYGDWTSVVAQMKHDLIQEVGGPSGGLSDARR